MTSTIDLRHEKMDTIIKFYIKANPTLLSWQKKIKLVGFPLPPKFPVVSRKDKTTEI